MNAVSQLQELLQANLHGRQSGIYSVCSSKEEIISSALLFARGKPYPLVIESTSNQVNQFGGYTGMRPQDFADYVHKLAQSCGYKTENLVLGGDHLGPNAWQGETAEQAMAKAIELVRCCIKASYRKIHLDTSMPCKGDSLNEALIAQRAAQLAQAAEVSWQEEARPGPAPVYIIGTEVPTPGGSKGAEQQLKPSNPATTKESYYLHRKAFGAVGLEEVWQTRVIAMVVQPGLEFGDEEIIYFDAAKSRRLSQLAPELKLVFEAHSTDYQRPHGLKELVKNHFAILKVGPWLSYAYREALFSLSHIAKELQHYKLLPGKTEFIPKVQSYLQQNPQHWHSYYRGSPEQIAYKTLYSLSDRIRYYWPQREMRKLCQELLQALGHRPLPYSLVSQYFPQAVQQLEPEQWKPAKLIEQQIQNVLAQYDAAVC